MKFHVAILILIYTSCFAQDSIPVFSHYLIDKEMNGCRSAQNQLQCLDSLIRVNLKTSEYSGKNHRKVYLDRFRKLFLYHLSAAHVSGSRANIERSFTCFDLSERYLDTLEQEGKAGEFPDFRDMIRHQKAELCIKTYRKDTAAFNRCKCKQFSLILKMNLS